MKKLNLTALVALVFIANAGHGMDIDTAAGYFVARNTSGYDLRCYMGSDGKLKEVEPKVTAADEIATIHAFFENAAARGENMLEVQEFMKGFFRKKAPSGFSAYLFKKFEGLSIEQIRDASNSLTTARTYCSARFNDYTIVESISRIARGESPERVIKEVQEAYSRK